MTARRIVVFAGISTAFSAWALGAACVPSGSAPPFDAGAPRTLVLDSPGALTHVFEETFDRPDTPLADAEAVWPVGEPAPVALTHTSDAGVDAAADTQLLAALDGGAELFAPTHPERYHPFGPNWTVPQKSANAWRIEEGRLCGQGALNHGVWLNTILPINARIEFDAISDSADGDLKAEVWGDGKSGATATSYTNATSYIAILGGWKNTAHVLARKNEHGKDRKELRVDAESDDPRLQPVSVAQTYRFKIERNDGKTVRFSVNDQELLRFEDPDPLVGVGHDHLGFNNYWAQIKSCYDNVKITPL